MYDVLVYGATSAGVVAAVQAARLGRTVCLLHPTAHVGGLSSAGLGFTDTGDKRVIGGLAREFYRRVHGHYQHAEAWRFEPPEQYARFDPNADAMWTFEPHVATKIFHQMLAEQAIDVVLRAPLDRDQGVTRANRRITQIRTLAGHVFSARQFIDATYEGDLLAAASVPYVAGREANNVYRESLNGVQTKQNRHNHRFLHPVDPYVLPGQPESGLLPLVEPRMPAPEGTGDKKIQAYCFRMCLTNVATNRVRFTKPPDYNELHYELLFRNFEAGDLRVPLHSLMMPNGKTDTNNNGAVSTDYIGANWSYPEASYRQRLEIVRRHLSYQQGLMWTLAHHLRVPSSVRAEVAHWGLAADEFTRSGHWPPELYVREARRMVGDYVVTEHDCRRHRLADDPIGLGSYNMDSHNVQRYVTRSGHVQNEGDVQVSPGGPYLISYRAIVPPAESLGNLLVPVCLSASHIAYGSVRMEPVFMILGQSAATAASLAIDNGQPVQQVPYDQLRRRLEADGQVVQLPTHR